MNEASEMKIRSLLPWFGAKRNLAPTIVEELGPHSAYWEPFCGSMAVLMAKPISSHETVNDLHSDLINLARIIQHQTEGPRLYRKLRRVLMSPDVLEAARSSLNSTDNPVDRAFAYFVDSWLGRNGVSGTQSSAPQSFAVRWSPNGGHGGRRLTSAVNSIPAWRRRMRGLTILNMDAFEILGKIKDFSGVAIYCDPPYLVKNARYTYDFTADDHRRLAELLNRFKRARVVVSYYDDPRLAELYPSPDWTQRKIKINKALANAQSPATKATAIEVLLVNGPSYASD